MFLDATRRGGCSSIRFLFLFYLYFFSFSPRCLFFYLATDEPDQAGEDLHWEETSSRLKPCL